MTITIMSLCPSEHGRVTLSSNCTLSLKRSGRGNTFYLVPSSQRVVDGMGIYDAEGNLVKDRFHLGWSEVDAAVPIIPTTFLQTF